MYLVAVTKNLGDQFIKQKDSFLFSQRFSSCSLWLCGSVALSILCFIVGVRNYETSCFIGRQREKGECASIPCKDVRPNFIPQDSASRNFDPEGP